jgi:Zn-dependent protease with chaperone function
VEVPTAVFAPEQCECGACGKKLFLPPGEPFTAISSSAYEHALDRTSLEALKAVPGFPAATRWMLAALGERSAYLNFLASNILCGPEQFPELLALLDQARRRLDLPYQPRCFLGESPHMNAMTLGVEEPLILVQSALLDQLDDAQVVAVLGHELGHLHSDHTLYRVLATFLLLGGAQLSGLMKLLTFPLQKALFHWSRCSELTADRAGLLASRDLSACLRLMLTFAGGNRPGTAGRTRLRLVPFVRQALALEELEAASWLDSALSLLLTMDASHPHAAWRVLHLVRWVESGNYLDILAGDYRRVKRPPPAA